MMMRIEDRLIAIPLISQKKDQSSILLKKWAFWKKVKEEEEEDTYIWISLGVCV